MKCLTFSLPSPNGPVERFGVVFLGQTVLDMNAAFTWWLGEIKKVDASQRVANGVIPSCLRGFIEGGSVSLEAAHALLHWFEARPEALQHALKQGFTLSYKLSEITWCSPLTRPNSLRDFISFEAHIKRGYEIRNKVMPPAWYDMPVYYKGNARTLIAHQAAILWPTYTQKLDYELEWACIIGQSGQNIKEEEAERHIFGYAILNDWSARDIQMKEMTCRLGPAKGKDFATSLGPYIVTRDEVPHPRDLKMTAHVNGEKWSEGNTGQAHWTWAQKIAYLSQEEMLYPTDILGSGTVGGGCGYELDRWLKIGDKVELEVAGLGVLSNTVVKTDVSS
jgi:2-keto-4-pentenoate hydratase/2-oxohepta-3-ene-1,7-dioic acid hydratase in catechol pathway